MVSDHGRVGGTYSARNNEQLLPQNRPVTATATGTTIPITSIRRRIKPIATPLLSPPLPAATSAATAATAAAAAAAVVVVVVVVVAVMQQQHQQYQYP
jgi:hypothetical protein